MCLGQSYSLCPYVRLTSFVSVGFFSVSRSDVFPVALGQSYSLSNFIRISPYFFKSVLLPVFFQVNPFPCVFRSDSLSVSLGLYHSYFFRSDSLCVCLGQTHSLCFLVIRFPCWFKSYSLPVSIGFTFCLFILDSLPVSFD